MSTEKDFTCPVCLEIFDSPRRIICGHVFCKMCLDQYKTSSDTKCPVCRAEFNPKNRKRVDDIESIMMKRQVICQTCSKNMLLSEMRAHTSECGAVLAASFRFVPSGETSQPIPSETQNRHTFKCPFCPAANFDSSGLREHCNKHHSRDKMKVVCPICASMPWGIVDQRSGDFLQHLNLRHKFEYDTYVDYERDDDVMLQQALQASMFQGL